jgi:hypothetical protein
MKRNITVINIIIKCRHPDFIVLAVNPNTRQQGVKVKRFKDFLPVKWKFFVRIFRVDERVPLEIGLAISSIIL